MRTFRLKAVVLAAVAVIGFTGCGLDSGSQGGAEGSTTVTIYTSRPKGISDGIVKDFQAAHPEYRVQLLNLGAQEVADRVRAEAARPQADVWWGGTSQQFELGAKDGVLQPFPTEIVDRVPERFRGSDNAWVGEQQLAQVIAYNHDMMTADEAPKDWDDLVDPRYKNKILIRDVAPSGTMRSIFGAMILRTFETTGSPDQGYDWLRKLDANTKDYPASPTDLYLRIQRQEAPLTVWNLQDVMLQTKAGVPFTPVIPASGSPILVDGIGKVKGAPNSEGADAFATFLLTKETQEKLAQNNFQIPTVQIDPPKWLTDLGLEEMPVDWSAVGAHDEEWIGYWVQNIKNHG